MSVLKSFTISGIATLGTCLVLFLIYTARHSYVPIDGSKGAVLDRVTNGPLTATASAYGTEPNRDAAALTALTVSEIVTSYKKVIAESVHIDSKERDNEGSKEIDSTTRSQSNLRSSAAPAASRLVSENKPATSDVRGNLGPASCVTNETMTDWLADRWQGKLHKL
jgi:hypothetical protein